MRITITMFYDLNIPYSPDDTALPRTLAFLKELGYTTVALNHTIAGKLPADLVSNNLPRESSSSITIRC